MTFSTVNGTLGGYKTSSSDCIKENFIISDPDLLFSIVKTKHPYPSFIVQSWENDFAFSRFFDVLIKPFLVNGSPGLSDKSASLKSRAAPKMHGTRIFW